jgi:restriction system protein
MSDNTVPPTGGRTHELKFDAAMASMTGDLRRSVDIPNVIVPGILLQATVINLGDHTNEGQLVEGVAIAWFEIIKQLESDPEFLFKIGWRKLEEIVAGAYEREGWPEVVLTPRSGDGGTDVIASRPGIGSIRILDQIKAYRQGHVVTADEIRSMLGVLQTKPNVSKGLVTTTSQFAPGIYKNEELKVFMPYRLELKDGPALKEWLVRIAKGNSAQSEP